ncbi:hypothetical protein [Vulgatibacter incomptus]|uniref:Lipoprotein n=1 Tax=Vulgatibacter incomptus TaxID=1391653 RepID=A0A0K1PB98_9BACT|nr:hypothetical protein [Vulgatibacter incomptus]AKU90399.1 hypothetical protein AKJ08_0786 [Vulgatibacter incomptus]
MRGRIAVATLCALASVLALSACRGGKPGADCKSSDDCALGLTCFAATCQELGKPSGTIAWYVIPPAASGLLPAAFPGQDGPLDLSLCASSISGSLDFKGRARLVVSGALESLPGVPERQELVVGETFTLPLAAGSWRLTFYPLADPTRSPPIVKEVKLAPCESLRLSPIEAIPDVRTARLRLVVDPLRDPRPRCGAWVRILSVSGEPLSQRLERRSPRTAFARTSFSSSRFGLRRPPARSRSGSAT